MIAIRIRSDVTSKGSRYSVNSERPISRPVACVKDPNVTPASNPATALNEIAQQPDEYGEQWDAEPLHEFRAAAAMLGPALSSMITKMNNTMIAPA